MTIQWQKCSKAPEGMDYRGSAATHGKMAYFNSYGSREVYQFDAEEDRWTTLPDCPYEYSAMVVTTAGLTTVGGRDGRGPTNRLVSLTVEGWFRKKQKWAEHFPRMPTSRYDLAAVCRGRTLIAAGGHDGVRRLSTVEILDMESLQWTPVCSLPHPMASASIAVGQEKVYLLGGFDQNVDSTLSVYVCLLSDLLQTQPLDAQLEKTANQLPVWHEAAKAPHYYSTAVCVGEVLLAIGGRSAAGEATSAIASYDPTSDSWEDMGHMTTPRDRPLVALLPSNELIVAGGNSGETEIGKIVA